MKDDYTDRMDVDKNISLYDYGVVRNPINNETMICLNPGTNEKPDIIIKHISIDDVAEALEDMPDSFWDSIGSDKDFVIDNLDNNDLSIWIYDINQWNGRFLPQW